MLFHLIPATRELTAWTRRCASLRKRVRETIEGEGGEILRLTIVGVFLRSPFPPLGVQPIYVRADCRYPEDSGTWFVREDRGGPATWVWRSDFENPNLPAHREGAAIVDNRVLALPPWVGWAGYAALPIGFLVLVWLF